MNDRLVDEMSLIAHESKAQQTAKRVVAKLHNDVPRQLIKVVIQAKVNNKVIARADIKAFRKDVTAKCVSQRQLLLVVTQVASLIHLFFNGGFDCEQFKTCYKNCHT